MPRKERGQKVAEASDAPAKCTMEALISVDGRGQIVLPKDLRTKAGLEAGDKLAVVTCEDEGEVCCIMLIKADTVASVIKGRLGPTMMEIMGRNS